MSTYDSGIDECTPAALIFKQSEDEGDSGGTKEDDD